LEVVYVSDNAPAFEQGAKENARVPRTDEVKGRAAYAGSPQSQGAAQADGLTGSVGSPRSTHTQHLLRNSADIRLVFKEGKRATCLLFTLLYRWNALGRTRVGVVVGKKLGGAVLRNRCKRRFRELARLSLNTVPQGLDLLILPKRDSAVQPATDLRESWQKVLKERLPQRKDVP
jgi:ribonuclease P protein component